MKHLKICDCTVCRPSESDFDILDVRTLAWIILYIRERKCPPPYVDLSKWEGYYELLHWSNAGNSRATELYELLNKCDHDKSLGCGC